MRYPAAVRSATIAWALRSVMPRLAATSRSRTPGSRLMHSSTRAWLVRKFQLSTPRTYHYILEMYCAFLVSGVRGEQIRTVGGRRPQQDRVTQRDAGRGFRRPALAGEGSTRH